MSQRSIKRRALQGLCLLAFLLCSGLGIWQLDRLAWKLDLMERVEQRLQAAPAAIPPSSQWPTFDAAGHEYRRVFATGSLLHDKETLVEALTERGAGFWVITPLRTADGLILVNRGFVPADRRGAGGRAQPPGEVEVTGLLRVAEPGGRFLRTNVPAEERWYSRDVAAIAERRGLGPVAPFFVDADSTPNPGGYPVGGLTVVSFRNAHLIYALTWFALAGLGVAGLVLLRKRAHTAA